MFAWIRAKAKGWKTMIVAAGYTVAGGILSLHDTIADALGQSGVDWKQLIDQKYVPYILIGTGVVFALLRVVTQGPIGAKGDAAPPANVKAGD